MVGPVGVESQPRSAQGFFEHLQAGWQASSGGLLWRQGSPDVFADPNASWYERAASSFAGLLGDLPVGAAGALAGMAVPVPGQGKLALAGAGGFAAPAVVREALMEYYDKGTVSPGKLATVAAKEAAIGALTLMTGGAVGRLLPEVAAGASKAAKVFGTAGRQAAIGGSELMALVGGSSVLDWRLPTTNDFIDNAVIIFGVRGAREIGVPVLRKIYERTGKTPDQVAQDAANDSQVAQDLLAAKIPTKYAQEAKTQAPVSDKPTPIQPRPLADPGPDAVRRTDYNLRHFDTPEGMADAAAILKDEMNANIELARRGTMNMQQIKHDAKLSADWLATTIGKGEKTRDPGDIANAGDTLAYGQLVHAGLENVRKASADIETIKAQVKDGSATKEDLDVAVAKQLVVEKQTQAIIADYLGNVAEVGRALRVVQEVSKSFGNTKKLRELLDAQPGGFVGVLNKAGIIHKSESHKAVAAAIKPTKFDKVVEYWKASILSGPTSMVVNFVSNAWFGATRIPYTFAAAMVSEARGSDAVMYRQVVGEAYGMTVGLVDGFKAFGRTLADHYTQDKLPDTTKAEQQGSGRGAIGGMTGKVVRTPFAILGAMDEMAKMVNGYMTAYGHAARQSKGDISKMVSPDFYREHTKDVLKVVERPAKSAKPTYYHGTPYEFKEFKIGEKRNLTVFPDAEGLYFSSRKEDAQAYAKGPKGRVVSVELDIKKPYEWPDDLPPSYISPKQRADLEAKGYDSIIFKGGDEVVVFDAKQVRETTGPRTEKTYEFVDDGSTLANLITKDGLRYTFQSELSPTAKRIMAAIYDSPAKYAAPFLLPFVRTPANIYSEALRMLPVLGAASGKQREEWAAGGARRDRAAAEHLVAGAAAVTITTLVASDLITGSGPADLTEQRAWQLTHQKYSVRIGGQWYSYARIEPLATVVGTLADLWHVKEYVSDSEYEMAGKALALAMRNQITDKTFLQGITNLVDVITPDEYGGQTFAQFAGTTVGGFVPNLLSQTDRVLDPEIREARGFVDRLINRVPYIRRGLLPKRDVFGDTFPHDRVWDALGVRVQPMANDPVRQEMARLGYAPKNITGREMDAMPGPLEGKVEFSDDQYDAFRSQAGQMAHSILGQITASSGYMSAPDAYKRAIVEQVFAQSRMTAQYGQLNADQINQAVQGAMQQLQ